MTQSGHASVRDEWLFPIVGRWPCEKLGRYRKVCAKNLNPPLPITGVLVWSLLEKACLARAPRRNASLRRIVLVAGRDGYSVALAASELDPVSLDTPSR
jgi:hypothetical protein